MNLRVPLMAVLLAIVCACKSPCARLDEKLCADLGPADCARWRAKSPPSNEGPWLTCMLVEGDRGYYEHNLQSVREGLAKAAASASAASHK